MSLPALRRAGLKVSELAAAVGVDRASPFQDWEGMLGRSWIDAYDPMSWQSTAGNPS